MKSRKIKFAWLRFLILLLAPLPARADSGDEVVVLYNSRVPQSKAVADYYAAKRHVPARQIFSFSLTTNEIMSRTDFTDDLQKPLLKDLVKNGFWKFGETTIPANAREPEHKENRVTESKIRYAVLCWGMPLKIAEDSSFIERVVQKMNPSLKQNQAAVDSELAWLPLIKLNVPLTGPLPNLLYGCTNRAQLTPQNGLLLVARLDGPTPEIAEGLVDKALEAESNGLWGRAYFDARGLQTNDAYYLGDEWMMAGANICRREGFDVELDTNAALFPASFPMSQIAIYAGWYSGDVEGALALPKVEFMPGAFAYHLHSFSAETIRSTTAKWCGPLLAKGATCTMGCVYEPYLQFTPNVAFFLQTFCSGYTFGEAAWAAQPALSWQTTVIGDPLYRPFNQPPQRLHAELAREKNPLIEWSFNRVINLDLVHGVRAPVLANFLENIPETAGSSVLCEKLANLYDMSGKSGSAIETWQRALTLNPTPQQRIRIRLTLGQKLQDDDRLADAMADYRQLIVEAPGYAGRNLIDEQLEKLEKEIASTK